MNLTGKSFKMPSKVELFKQEVEDELFDFLQDYGRSIQELINKAKDPAIRRDCQKLKNYSHNIILRRAGLETTTYIFGSRAIGTSTDKSDLDLYVDARKYQKMLSCIFKSFNIFQPIKDNCQRKFMH